MQQRAANTNRYAREVVERLRGRLRLISPPSPLDGLRAHLWEQFTLPRLLRADELLLSPNGTGPLRVARQVVMLPDLTPVTHTEDIWLRFLLPRLLQTVRAVILPSETQRRQAVARFRLPPEQVFSVPCGVDLQRFHPARTEAIMAVRRAFGLPSDYFFLYVGRKPGLDLRRLIQDWQPVYRQYPRLCLAIYGVNPPASPASQQLAHPGVRFLGSVDLRDLPALYSGALAAVFPSPEANTDAGQSVLEALACGVPVIAVQGGLLAEMAGDAALLVNPDTSALAQAMLSIATDARLQAGLCCRGLERVRQFSWDETAGQIYSILQSLS